jgi:hypothetical protein
MKSRVQFNQEIIYVLLATAVISIVVGFFQKEPKPYFIVAVVIVLIAMFFNLKIDNKPIQGLTEMKILLVFELLNCQEEIDKLDFIDNIEDEVVLDEIKKKHLGLSQKMKTIENKIKILDKMSSTNGQNT